MGKNPSTASRGAHHATQGITYFKDKDSTTPDSYEMNYDYSGFI